MLTKSKNIQDGFHLISIKTVSVTGLIATSDKGSEMKNYRKKRLHIVCRQAIIAMTTTAVLSTTAFAEQEQSKNVDNSETAEIEVIEVEGTRDALAEALDRKRESKNVSDSIIAEDIGKMPDENIAEALQRVTGVSIQRDMGEGTTVNIRGMGGDFNQIKVNGQTLTSGGNGRDVDFSSMSADLLAAIEVVKSPSASHDEGSIGGAINLKTRRPLDIQKDQVFSFEFKEAYNDLTEEFDPNIAVTYIRNIDDKFGASASLSYENRHVRQDTFFTRGWRPIDLATIDDSDLNVEQAEMSRANINADADGIGWTADDVGQRLDLQERERLGGTVNFQYRPTDDIDTHLDITFSEFSKEQDWYQNWHRFRYNAPRYDNATGETEHFVNNMVFDKYGTMTQGDFYADAGASLSGNKGVARQTNTRSERTGKTTTTSYLVGLGAEWRLDQWTVSGELGFSASKEENDNEQQYLFAANNTTQGYAVSDDDLVNVHAAGDLWVGRWDNPHSLNQIRNNVREIEDENYSAQLDFNYALDNEFFDSLEFGAKWTERQKDKEDDSTYIKMWLEDVENTDKIRASFMDPDNPTPFPVDNFLTGIGANNTIRDWSVIDFDNAEQNALNVFGVDSFDELPFDKYRDFRNSFNLNIETRAIYALLNIDAFDGRLVGDVGVRYVETDRTSVGYAGNQFTLDEYREGLDNYARLPVIDYRDVNVEKEYDNVLSSLNLRYALDDDKLVRFAVAEVMARPNFWEIAPYQKLSPLVTPAGLWGGNPYLDPFEATQADASFEWYFDKGALASVGVFYKDISSFYYNKVTEGVTIDPETGDPYWENGDGTLVEFRTHQPANGAGGEILGVETSYQQNFNFLPGLWSNFGTVINYTYSDSEADYLKLEAAEESPLKEVDLPFPNQSKHTANATLYYEDKGINIRLAYSYRSESIITPAGSNANAIWNDSYQQLDFSAGYGIGKNYWLSLQAVNLTDEVQERYATSPTEGNSLEGDGPTNRLYSVSQSGRIFRIGIRGRF